MSRSEALVRLRALATADDSEAAHVEADAILLALIDDDAIAEAYRAIRRWYA